MDFGGAEDDDDDWDANELDALEVAAVHKYAATQRSQNPVPVQKRSGNENQAEEQRDESQYIRLEKLVQAKQGELLILKSNIVKTSADHANALETARSAVRAVRDDLSRQLETYKDKVTQLETDLTFQRQELKEAKLRIAQSVKVAHIPPQTTARLSNRNGSFPDRSAFEADVPISEKRANSGNKKRKRNGQAQADLDDFDLADIRARQRSVSHMGIHESNNVEGYEMDVDQPLTPVLSPRLQAEQIDVAADPTLRTDTKDPHNPFGLPELDLITVHKRILEATDSSGENCMQSLMAVTMEAGDGRSLGQSLLEGLYSGPATNSPDQVLCTVATLVISQIMEQKHHAQIAKLFSLLEVFLQCSSYVIGTLILEHICASNAFVQDIFAQACTEESSQLRQESLRFLGRLSTALDRDTNKCAQLLSQLSPNLYRTLGATDQDGSLRISYLQSLAKLCAPSTSVTSPAEMLDVTSAALERNDLPATDSWQLCQTSCQFLYCFIVNCDNGMTLARQSRYIVPRLLRRLARELNELYHLSSPKPNMSLIKMVVKLYHVLVKDEDNSTTELHWRLPETRAIHLTAMTRILYAEEEDEIDNEMQDLAMDLLEMAVSPEEGNDIYEVMGGISSE